MQDEKKYIDSIHLLGRVGTFIALAFMLGIPAIMCIVYNCWPSLSTVMTAGGTLLAMFVPSAFSEVISYAPARLHTSHLLQVTFSTLNCLLPFRHSLLQALLPTHLNPTPSQQWLSLFHRSKQLLSSLSAFLFSDLLSLYSAHRPSRQLPLTWCLLSSAVFSWAHTNRAVKQESKIRCLLPRHLS